jgi:hypothetical protein
MNFSDQVKSVYGPIPGWDARLDADDPDGLGPRGLTLRCDRLGVAQLSAPDGGRATAELAAENNVQVEVAVKEGRVFARSVRMTYSQAKDLMILEGDGRTNAELWHQKYPGGPLSTTSARKIHCWPSINQLNVDGVHWLEVNDLPMGNLKRR